MTNPSFEWDPVKNASNLAKHGVDFDTAAEIFEDPDCREIFSRTEGGEERFLALGMVWTGSNPVFMPPLTTRLKRHPLAIAPWVV